MTPILESSPAMYVTLGLSTGLIVTTCLEYTTLLLSIKNSILPSTLDTVLSDNNVSVNDLSTTPFKK